jgi:hypothetical protein
MIPSVVKPAKSIGQCGPRDAQMALKPLERSFAHQSVANDCWVSCERNEKFVLSNAETDTPLARIEISDVNGVLVEPGHFRVVPGPGPGADAATAERARSKRSDA